MSLFFCAICTLVCFDPVQCQRGHLFCRNCINEALLVKSECPNCRIRTTSEHLSDNLIVKNFIGEMTITCSNSENCDWVGPTKNLRAHFDKDCGFQKVRCCNYRNGNGCCLLIDRKDAVAHVLDCSFAIFICNFCQKSGTKKDFQRHLRACDKRPTNCPLNCGAVLPFCDIDHHRSTECEMELVNCNTDLSLDSSKGNRYSDRDRDRVITPKLTVQKIAENFFANLSGTQINVFGEVKRIPNSEGHPLTCPARVPRRDLAEHQRSCEYRIVKCPYCRKDGPHNCLEHHLSNCKERPSKCTLGCNADMPFFQLRYHTSSECLLRMVACPFQDLGCSCGGTVRFCDKEAHASDTLVLMNAVAKLTKEVMWLRSERRSSH